MEGMKLALLTKKKWTKLGKGFLRNKEKEILNLIVRFC